MLLANGGDRDFLGRALCTSCWNNFHACVGGRCECLCRVLEKEQPNGSRRVVAEQREFPAGNMVTIR